MAAEVFDRGALWLPRYHILFQLPKGLRGRFGLAGYYRLCGRPYVPFGEEGFVFLKYGGWRTLYEGEGKADLGSVTSVDRLHPMLRDYVRRKGREFDEAVAMASGYGECDPLDRFADSD